MVTAARSLLRGDVVTVSGQLVWAQRGRAGLAAAHPFRRWLVGARGPKTLALAGELADGLSWTPAFRSRASVGPWTRPRRGGLMRSS